MTSIMIGGDILPTENNQEYFTEGRMEDLIGEEAYSLFRASDFGLFNLEGPLTTSDDKILKIGPCIKGNTSSVNGLSVLGNRPIASLANNHILDYGSIGLKETVRSLNDKGILPVGAGNNLREARQPIVVEKNGIKIGIISYAEREFTIASEKNPGANPYEPLTTYDDIRILKTRTDYVIVLYHGGIEFFQYPAPYLRQICRKMADEGADIIACQHSHCVGIRESYKDSIILYGQGNFVLCMNDGYMDPQLSSNGLLMRVEFEYKKKPAVNFIPIIRYNDVVRIAEKDTKEKILRDLAMRSKQAEDEEWVEKQYHDFLANKMERYLNTVLGRNAKILKLFHIHPEKMYRDFHLAEILNVIRCEAHRDAFMNIILDKINEGGY